MNYKEPENLPAKTPQWFRKWYESSFWHFQYDINSRLSRVEKLTWFVIGAVIVCTVTERFI